MIIALSLVLKTPVVHAAKYRYLVVYFVGGQAEGQKEMDKEANDGWEFLAPIYSERSGGSTQALLVFRKE
jgi:hypothetical protein